MQKEYFQMSHFLHQFWSFTRCLYVRSLKDLCKISKIKPSNPWDLFLTNKFNFKRYFTKTYRLKRLDRNCFISWSIRVSLLATRISSHIISDKQICSANFKIYILIKLILGKTKRCNHLIKFRKQLSQSLFETSALCHLSSLYLLLFLAGGYAS